MRRSKWTINSHPATQNSGCARKGQAPDMRGLGRVGRLLAGTQLGASGLWGSGAALSATAALMDAGCLASRLHPWQVGGRAGGRAGGECFGSNPRVLCHVPLANKQAQWAAVVRTTMLALRRCAAQAHAAGVEPWLRHAVRSSGACHFHQVRALWVLRRLGVCINCKPGDLGQGCTVCGAGRGGGRSVMGGGCLLRHSEPT